MLAYGYAVLLSWSTVPSTLHPATAPWTFRREYASAHGGLSDMDPGSPGSHTASPFPEDWSLKT